MALSEALIKQFQALHLDKYGKAIDAATAEFELKQLAELVRIAAPNEEIRK